MDLKGKAVIITGAGSGIGRMLAIGIAREGAAIVCCGRRENRLRETVSLIENEGGRALAIPADVTEKDQVKGMVSRAVDELGRVDVLINNAGSFAAAAGLWECDPDVWWHDVEVNLRGTMICCHAVLPSMMEQDEGIIINMDGGRPVGGTGYACGKAGLMELTRILVEELKMAESSIIVLGAGPGLGRTEMTELQADTDAGRKWIPSTKESFDSGRLRKPEEVAAVTIEVVKIARPELSGTRYGPDTDVASL